VEDPDQSAPPDDGTAPSGLSDRDLAVLALESRSWPSPGVKERAIRERLGISPIQYYQQLNALLNDPNAAAHAPTTVNRLRAARAERRGEAP
jgi:hypothetical protein